MKRTKTDEIAPTPYEMDVIADDFHDISSIGNLLNCSLLLMFDKFIILMHQKDC